MYIEPMSGSHLNAACEIHIHALRGDFLPSLGYSFLKTLYEGILGLGLGFGFVAVEQDGTVGFVLASLDSSGLFRRLILKRGPALAIRTALAVLRSPRLAPRVIETFLYPARGGQVPYKAELIALAVQEASRSQGIGEALLHRLHEEFRRLGVDGYKVTVYGSNAGANRFYRRMGGQYAHSFVLYGREWNLYTYSLAGVEASAGDASG
jgi:ribosomal protein S18 acetylase RimI-like enzyme